MAANRPHYSKEEFARRGDAIYERELRSVLEPDHNGEFVVIDIETGAYEVDADELAATHRLAKRLPNAQPWMRRVGYPYARRMFFTPKALHSAAQGRASAPWESFAPIPIYPEGVGQGRSAL